MGIFRKRFNPVSDRAKALNREIAELESQIRRLNTQLDESPAAPRLRSTAIPHGPTVFNPVPSPPAAEPEPVFEAVDQTRLKSESEVAATPEHFNEMGVRKYDLLATWRRLGRFFQGPATSNPKLVNYLAAGSIQGLQPLRYEKRVARNRFLLLVICFLAVLWGLFVVLFRGN